MWRKLRHGRHSPLDIILAARMVRRMSWADYRRVFPFCSRHTLERVLRASESSGVLRTRKVPNRRKRYWYITPLGRDMLRVLRHYRPWWPLVNTTDMVKLAQAMKIMRTLEAERWKSVPRKSRYRFRWNYWERRLKLLTIV